MIGKYLPVGTVVTLKGGKKRIMITGFACKTADSNKVYDYCGCLYPEGFIASDQNLLFDHEQIESISYMGLIDEEEKNFKQKLNQTVQNTSVKFTESNQNQNTEA